MGDVKLDWSATLPRLSTYLIRPKWNLRHHEFLTRESRGLKWISHYNSKWKKINKGLCQNIYESCGDTPEILTFPEQKSRFIRPKLRTSLY